MRGTLKNKERNNMVAMSFSELDNKKTGAGLHSAPGKGWVSASTTNSSGPGICPGSSVFLLMPPNDFTLSRFLLLQEPLYLGKIRGLCRVTIPVWNTPDCRHSFGGTYSLFGITNPTSNRFPGTNGAASNRSTCDVPWSRSLSCCVGLSIWG